MQERKAKHIPIKKNGKLYFVCKECGIEKELTSDFWRKESKLKMGYNPICKECLKPKDKKRREEHIDTIRESSRRGQAKYRITHKDKIEKYRKWYEENNKEKLREHRKKYNLENRDMLRERRRASWDVTKQKRLQWIRENKDIILLKSRQRNHQKGYASIHIKTARVIRKMGIRPKICSICGYGGQIVAHHPDYNKPYEVVFCCQSCHKLIHLGEVKVSEDKKVLLR